MEKIIASLFTFFLFVLLVDISFIEPYVKEWKDFSSIAKVTGIGFAVTLVLLIIFSVVDLCKNRKE